MYKISTRTAGESCYILTYKISTEVVRMCKNRTVLFDNNTEDEKKKASHLQKLLSLVDKVIEDNGGQPYTDSLFVEFKEAALLQQQKEEVIASEGHTKQEIIELTEQIQKSYDEQLKRMTEMVASKLKETNERLQEQCAEKAAEEAQREAESKIQMLSKNLAEAVKCAEESKSSSEDEINKLRDRLADAHKLAQDAHNKCAIL